MHGRARVYTAPHVTRHLALWGGELPAGGRARRDQETDRSLGAAARSPEGGAERGGKKQQQQQQTNKKSSQSGAERNKMEQNQYGQVCPGQKCSCDWGKQSQPTRRIDSRAWSRVAASGARRGACRQQQQQQKKKITAPARSGKPNLFRQAVG